MLYLDHSHDQYYLHWLLRLVISLTRDGFLTHSCSNLDLQNRTVKLLASSKRLLWQEIGAILQSIAAEDNFNTLVGDNIDRNTTTLDGRRTFHGMGVIAVITNKNSTCQEEPLRNRSKKLRDVCVYVYLKRSNFGGKEFREPAKFREFLLFFSNFSFKKKSSKQHSQKLLLVKIISPEVVYLFLDIKKNLKLLEEFFKCVDLTF